MQMKLQVVKNICCRARAFLIAKCFIIFSQVLAHFFSDAMFSFLAETITTMREQKCLRGCFKGETENENEAAQKNRHEFTFGCKLYEKFRHRR